jgi:hypothetical protein
MSEGKKNVSLEQAVQRAVASVVHKAPPPVNHVAQSKDRIVRIRDRHHQIARMVAAKVPYGQICKVMGITLRNLEMLVEQTPAFIELISYYRQRAETTMEIVEYIDTMNANMLVAEQILRDQLNSEDADQMSPSVLNKLAMDRADRLGYGKQSTNINVNVDFASAVEAARKRSGKLRRESPGVAAGDGGASSTDADTSSAPPVLELKAEPVVDQPSPHPVPPPLAQPPVDPEEVRQAALHAKHPVASYLKAKYAPVAERIPGYAPVPRRI